MDKVKLHRQEGSITVFLSIILLIIVVLAGTLVDGSRIYVAKSQLRRTTKNAARSTLANYDSKLKERYGLFAIDGSNDNEITNTILYFTQKNLNPVDHDVVPKMDKSKLNIKSDGTSAKKSKKYLNLYDYDINKEHLLIKAERNLGENNVLEQQILEYMKYRAPKELMENLLKKLDILKKSGKTAELVEKKVDIETSMNEIGEKQNKLAKQIIKINRFSKGKCQELKAKTVRSIETFNKLTDEISNKKKEVKALLPKINELDRKSRYLQLKIDDKSGAINNIQSTIDSLNKQLEDGSKGDNGDENVKATNESNSQKKLLSDLESKKSKLQGELDQLNTQHNSVAGESNSLKEKVNILQRELTRLEVNRTKEFYGIKKSYSSLKSKISQYKDSNNSAIEMADKLTVESIYVQRKINGLESNLRDTTKYKGQVILEVENQINKDIKDYNSKIKGVITNSNSKEFETRGYSGVNLGDESFNTNNLDREVRKAVGNKIKQLKKIINDSELSKEHTGISEFIERIVPPIVANYEILSKVERDISDINKRIEEIEKIISNDSISEEFKKFDGSSRDKLNTKLNIINNYSNNIKYLQPRLKKVSDSKTKDFKNKMEKRDTSLIRKDNTFEVKGMDTLSSKGYEISALDKKRFEKLPSKDTKDNKVYNSNFIKDKETDSKLIKDSLGFVTNLANGIKEGSLEFRNNLYINEYILGTFRSGADEKTIEKNSGIVLDFFGKYERPSYFSDKRYRRKDVEIEYILHGNLDQKKNLMYTKGQIYTIRVVMNLLHIFADSRKMKFATNIGKSVAWIPIAAPIITTVVIFGWSSLESFFDLNQLMNGEEVPFYKISDEEWNLGVGTLKEYVSDKAVEVGMETAEDMVINFVDKIINMIFIQVEDEIMKSIIEVEEVTDRGVEDIKENIEKSVDASLQDIPNQNLRNEIKGIILKPLFDNIDSQVTNIIEKAQTHENDRLNKVKGEISSTIKNEIQNSLNPIKERVRENLKRKVKSSKVFQEFVKENGDTVLNDMSDKNFNVKFSYQDYLRILLISKDKEIKLRRIMDLIQLNSQEKNKEFSIYNYQTLLKVDVITSIKYIFMTGKFVPEKLRLNEENRHIIKSSIIEGY